MTYKDTYRQNNGAIKSPYSGGMASPYSDHSSGVPSPPTVVSEYNRPIDVVNTDGPHLVVTEQPQSKFRFRYKSEMVGTHGQLKAERADRNKPIFPTVKLVNWKDGPALIRLALYTGEDNFNQRTRHVHELGGKNCDKDTGMCEMVVDQTTDYTASFQNLGIIHIAKRDVRDIIKHRKKKELIDHVHLRQPHRPIEEIRQSITPTDMKKFDEEAEEISKMMDLNKVVLRFQAFHYDTSVDCYRALTRPVDSELVVNLKNASTGELKIVRMSECSAPCTGGTDVWMLVEKVKKSNIKIKFYELDSEFKEVWSAYGEFSEADVHHQYAIIFRTPPYRTTNLRQSVRVKVQLERPNDKDISEPRDFTYYPSNRKRQSPFMESTKVEEDEDYSNEVGGGGNGGGRNKRHCHESTEPLDLRYCEFTRTFPYQNKILLPKRRASSFHIPYPSGDHLNNYNKSEGISCNSNRRYSDTSDSMKDMHDGSLFRSNYERRIDREQSDLKDLEEIIKTECETERKTMAHLETNNQFENEFKYSNLQMHSSLPDCSNYSDYHYIPINKSSLNSNPSSPLSTSPCNKPIVYTHFNHLPTKYSSRSFNSLNKMRNYHSLESETTPYSSNTLQIPSYILNSRSSSSQSLKTSFERQCNINSQVSENPSIYREMLPLNYSAESLPDLASNANNYSPQQSNNRTYTELKPTQTNYFKSFVSGNADSSNNFTCSTFDNNEMIQPSTNLSVSGSHYTSNRNTSNERSEGISPVTLSPITVTISTPEDDKPHPLLWDL